MQPGNTFGGRKLKTYDCFAIPLSIDPEPVYYFNTDFVVRVEVVDILCGHLVDLFRECSSLSES